LWGEHADQHDRAGDGDGQAKQQAGGDIPTEGPCQKEPEASRNADLDDRSRNGNAPDRDELFDMKVEPDAEHQQDHPDFGQLLCQSRMSREARRERADGNASDQVADDASPPVSVRIKSSSCGIGSRARRCRSQCRPRQAFVVHEHAADAWEVR